MDTEIKKKLLDHCFKRTEGRVKEITLALKQSQEAIESDTKSSAGDKYETSREMIQQDLNRYHMQLSQAKKDWILLQKINIGIKEKAEIGAIAVTEQVAYFVAISLGELQVNGMRFMVISPSSPIGKLLLECKVGNEIIFNGTKQRITAIY